MRPDVVATTITKSGQTIDWIRPESQVPGSNIVTVGERVKNNEVPTGRIWQGNPMVPFPEENDSTRRLRSLPTPAGRVGLRLIAGPGR